MPLKPAVPTIIGQPQTARKNVHPVAMPNPLKDLGDSISGLANPLGRLGLGFAIIQHDRDMADYRRTLNDAISEANQRMNDEVFSQEGFAAEGSLERAGNIFKDVWSKYGGKVNGAKNKQRLEEEFGAFKNNQMNRTMGFERNNLTNAQIGANNQLIKSGTSAYVESLDPAMMAIASQAHDDNWRIRNGGYLVNNAAVEAFKRDMEDEDGRITLRDGRKLDIVEEAEPGTPGVITKKQAESILKNMEKQAAAYESSRMSMWDMAHSEVIDRYLSQDRVADADSYLKDVDNRGLISKDAKQAATEAIGRKREVVEVSTESTKLLDELQAAAGGDSIAYGSPLQDRLYTETMREIDQKYTGEKYKLGQQIKSQFAEKYRLLQDAQKARAAQDTVNAMMEMQEARMDLPAMKNKIMSMKDSPVKTALLKAYDRQEEAARADRAEFNNNADPDFLVEQEDKLTALKLALADGHAELDGIPYDFSNKDQLTAYIKNLGFTDKNKKRAAEYISDSKARIDAVQAGMELAKQLGGGYTPAEAFADYPWILAELERIKGTTVIEQEKMGQWLKSNISALLEQEATNWNRIKWNTTGTLLELSEQGVPMDDIYQNEEQLLDAYRRVTAQQAMQRGDVKAAKAALEAKPGKKELDDFAKNRRGMTYRKGNYYYTGGK